MQRLKPPEKGQVDIFDQGFPGLALRISYGGRRSWVFFYRFGGKLRRMTLGTYPAPHLAEARHAWRALATEAHAAATLLERARSIGQRPTLRTWQRSGDRGTKQRISRR